MGGVAFREVATRLNPRQFAGIVTVGSPLNGALVANAIRDGRYDSFMTNGINELQKGPRRQRLGIGAIMVRTAYKLFTGRDIQEILLALFGADGESIIDSRGPQSIEDLSVGSSYMQTAVQLEPSVPHISLYGNENSPVHYRLMSSARFENKPDFFPNVFRDAKGVYNSYYISSLVLTNPLRLWQAAGWKAGRDFIDRQSEAQYNDLIGATRTEEITSCYRTFTCSYDWYYSNCSNGNYTTQCDDCWREVCESRTRTYNEVSDGFINKSSQLGESTLITNSNWTADRAFELREVNHLQYDDHPNSIARLRNIFDGVGVNPVFIRTR